MSRSAPARRSQRAHRGADDASDSPLSLYVHIPFCETKCPYCDFNTYAGIERLIPDYVSALVHELSLWGKMLGRPEVATVFFGGGTPSYLPAGHVASILQTVRDCFALAPDSEVTLESNPGDFGEAKLAAYLERGVNRLSIGVQSLDDSLLRMLGRRHSAEQAVQAYTMALAAGFDNVSVDLMYGLPYQTEAAWRDTLRGVLELEPPHVSAYCLTLEEGTPMHRWVDSGQVAEPDPDLAADMYEHTERAMESAGYRHYEISNWARDGYESRHNLTYWRNQPYLGVGPGAHSYLGSFRFHNLRSPREYVRSLQEAPAPAVSLAGCLSQQALGKVPVVEEVEPIDRRLEMAETLMMGLRLDVGVSIDEFAQRFDTTPQRAYGDTIDELLSLGLLERAAGHLRLTPRGRILGNEVFARFF